MHSRVICRRWSLIHPLSLDALFLNSERLVLQYFGIRSSLSDEPFGWLPLGTDHWASVPVFGLHLPWLSGTFQQGLLPCYPTHQVRMGLAICPLPLASYSYWKNGKHQEGSQITWVWVAWISRYDFLTTILPGENRSMKSLQKHDTIQYCSNETWTKLTRGFNKPLSPHSPNPAPFPTPCSLPMNTYGNNLL